MKKINYLSLSMCLLLLSGLLWGLIGVFDFDLVRYLTEPCWFTRVIYFIFGVAAVYVFCKWKVLCGAKKK